MSHGLAVNFEVKGSFRLNTIEDGTLLIVISMMDFVPKFFKPFFVDWILNGSYVSFVRFEDLLFDEVLVLLIKGVKMLEMMESEITDVN